MDQNRVMFHSRQLPRAPGQLGFDGGAGAVRPEGMLALESETDEFEVLRRERRGDQGAVGLLAGRGVGAEGEVGRMRWISGSCAPWALAGWLDQR